MTASGFDPARFESNPVLGIIRGITGESLHGVLDAVVEAGLDFVEITLNTAEAVDLIQQAVGDYADTPCIGAGTVLSVEDADKALANARGYYIPYMVTGTLDVHPRAAMALLNSDQRDDYLNFYEKLVNEGNI